METSRSDNDVYGHINNSIYGILIDSIVNAYLIDRCGLEPQLSEQIGLVVNSYCDFFASISYPAVVELGLGIVDIGRSSVKYEVGVFEEGEDEVKAVGGFTHVFVDRRSRRPDKKGMNANLKSGLLNVNRKTNAKL